MEGKRRYRYGRFTVPVVVEDAVGLLHGGAGNQQIQVLEIHIGACAEVLLADVAATDDRDSAVGNPTLVVHAVVHAESALHQFQRARDAAAVAERVVEADFNVRVPVQRHHQRVLVLGVHVVKQDAHAHTALGGVVQRLGHQVADQVVVPDVVLQVQAAACVRGDHRACGEGIHAITEERHAGLSGVCVLQRHDFLVDAGLRRLQWQHMRGCALGPWREMVGQQQPGQNQQQQRGEDDCSDAQQASPQGLGQAHAPMVEPRHAWMKANRFIAVDPRHAWMPSSGNVTPCADDWNFAVRTARRCPGNATAARAAVPVPRGQYAAGARPSPAGRQR